MQLPCWSNAILPVPKAGGTPREWTSGWGPDGSWGRASCVCSWEWWAKAKTAKRTDCILRYNPSSSPPQIMLKETSSVWPQTLYPLWAPTSSSIKWGGSLYNLQSSLESWNSVLLPFKSMSNLLLVYTVYGMKTTSLKSQVSQELQRSYKASYLINFRHTTLTKMSSVIISSNKLNRINELLLYEF